LASPEEITDRLKKLKKDSELITTGVIELVVYSEGSFDWNTCWGLSNHDRVTIIKVLTDFNKKKSGSQVADYL